MVLCPWHNCHGSIICTPHTHAHNCIVTLSIEPHEPFSCGCCAHPSGRPLLCSLPSLACTQHPFLMSLCTPMLPLCISLVLACIALISFAYPSSRPLRCTRLDLPSLMSFPSHSPSFTLMVPSSVSHGVVPSFLYNQSVSLVHRVPSLFHCHIGLTLSP